MPWPPSGRPWPIRCCAPTRRSGCTSTARTPSCDREDRAWLLVDLGAGLLEEADPKDVVAELLPDVPPDAQAELVAGLWRVRHPGVTDLLTALSDHHPIRGWRGPRGRPRSRPARSRPVRARGSS